MRVSFLGGGTDYPDHFLRHGGQTLATAIDKCSYVTVNNLARLFDYSIKVSYARTELAGSVDQVEHPAVRECLRFMRLDGGIEVSYMGDLPARTGLGSSSSFTVGLLCALHAFKGELASAQQLAAEAVYVEQEMIKERVGVQDQYTCAYGGLVHLEFGRAGDVRVSPVPLHRRRIGELQSRLMLIYTGIRRHAHAVLDEQLERTENGTITGELCYLSDLVDQGLEVLTGDGPIAAFGELLHSAWMAKQRLSSKITSPQISRWYERARQAGAVGGKLLGAGGGGFLLLFVEPDRQRDVRWALNELRPVPFSFDFGGSKLLYYHPPSDPFASTSVPTPAFKRTRATSGGHAMSF